jgi:hypothetical protein
MNSLCCRFRISILVFLGTLAGDVLPSPSSSSVVNGRKSVTPMPFASIDRDRFLSAIGKGCSSLEPSAMAQMIARNTSLAFGHFEGVVSSGQLLQFPQAHAELYGH